MVLTLWCELVQDALLAQPKVAAYCFCGEDNSDGQQHMSPPGYITAAGRGAQERLVADGGLHAPTLHSTTPGQVQLTCVVTLATACQCTQCRH